MTKFNEDKEITKFNKEMNTFTIDEQFILYRDGTVKMFHFSPSSWINYSWDTEEKVRALYKEDAEYTVAALRSMDVFTPVNTWSVQWPNKIPEWLDISVTEKKIRTVARRWARRHIFQNRRFPVWASKARAEYYVKNCRSVHLTGYKASVLAAGNTRVTVQNAETSVYMLDEKVKLNKGMFTIPETTNLYTLFNSPTVTADTASQPADESTTCDQIIRMEERGSLSDREHIVLDDPKESFERFERGTNKYGCFPGRCFPGLAAEKFSPNVIHYNESLTLLGARETHCLSVYCKDRWYIWDHISEEKCLRETEKLLSFARENGYLIEKHDWLEWNTPVDKQAEEQEIKYLQELGIKYTTEFYNEDYYYGYINYFHNDQSGASSDYDGCDRPGAGLDQGMGMRQSLLAIGLTDSQIDEIRDKNNGPIANLITSGDLYYETTDICSLITHADGSFIKSQIMASLLQPDLQESADLAM